MMLRVKVTNRESGVIFEHNDVPREHVEMLKLNPYLKVEVLEIDMHKKRRAKKRLENLDEYDA